MIPEWLASEILAMSPEQVWKIGSPTKKATSATQSLVSTEGIQINPHRLRHWLATNMASKNIPPHTIMKQMFHKNVQTAMAVYSQVSNDHLLKALPRMPEPQLNE